VVARHEPPRRHDLMAVALEIVEECRPDVVDATHGPAFSGGPLLRPGGSPPCCGGKGLRLLAAERKAVQKCRRRQTAGSAERRQVAKTPKAAGGLPPPFNCLPP